MWFGRGDYGHHSLDRYSAIAGMSAVGFTAIIPSFYRSTPRVLKVPRSRAAIFIAPALCGSIACFSWQYVVSDPIKRRKMECVSCAAIRGSLTLGLSGCVVPSVLIASLHFGGRTGTPQPFFTSFLDFCYSPYYGRSKAFIIGLGLFQAVLGYGLASWVYTDEFINRRSAPSWFNARCRLYRIIYLLVISYSDHW